MIPSHGTRTEFCNKTFGCTGSSSDKLTHYLKNLQLNKQLCSKINMNTRRSVMG